jgi:phosphate-selective porin OprO/OprP
MVAQLTASHTPPALPQRAAPAPSPAPAPVVRAGREGFGLRSADGDFTLRVGGYVHADTRLYVGDHAGGTDQFVLRRVRPNVEGTVFRQFTYRIVPDFAEGKAAVQDAYVDARFHPWFQVLVGKYKAPVGFERLRSSLYLPFVERAFPTALVPNRDIGVSLHGDSRNGVFSYAAGVFNGGLDGGSVDGDDQDGKDFAGRVFFLPSAGRADRPYTLGIGVSGTAGVQTGTPLAPNLPVYKSNGQLPIFRYRAEAGDPGPARASGARYRWSTHGYYFHGPAGILAEHVVSSQQVARGAAALRARNTAFQVQGSFVLTGERASYAAVAPAHPFDSAKRTWGAFEIVGRVQKLAMDRDLFPYFANPQLSVSGATAAGVGLNWYLNGAVKIATDYERTVFQTAGTVRRPPENDLFSRIQFSF